MPVMRRLTIMMMGDDFILYYLLFILYIMFANPFR